jgi:N-acetylglucosaminyl-diphospho-decaprenol L-rhamnosyltransferase
MTHIAVAIVGFRNTADIVSCLNALESCVYGDFEVVICENGGPVAFEELISAIPTTLAGGQLVRAVMAPGNLGYAGGVNVCVKHTPNADAWWVLNPDTEPYADAMGKMVERLTAGDVDAVGNTIFLGNGKVQSYGGQWQGWLARAVSIGHSSEAALPPDPASIMISRRYLETAGLMREDYFLYCEEVEWCLRGIEHGMKLGFEPGAFVLHQVGTTTGNDPDIRKRRRLPTYLGERNKILLTRDCFPGRMPIVAFTSLGMIFAKYGRRRAWRQVGYAMSGWWAGLQNQRGVPSWVSS